MLCVRNAFVDHLNTISIRSFSISGTIIWAYLPLKLRLTTLLEIKVLKTQINSSLDDFVHDPFMGFFGQK